MEELCLPKPVKLITVIVDRGRGKKAIKILNDYATTCQFAALGIGTASEGTSSFFGFSDTARDIVFTVVSNTKVDDIMQELKEKLNLQKPNSGIAFTIPVKCVASLLALQYMIGEIKE